MAYFGRALVFFLVGLLALAGILFSLALLLLPSCDVRLPTGVLAARGCPSPEIAENRSRMRELNRERGSLEDRVRGLERRLALLQCAQPPAPENEASLPPDDGDDSEDIAEGIDPEAWENQDLRAMEGCWQLDSDYTTRDLSSGNETSYSEWEMCFDAQGNGTQKMRGNDGSTCDGTVEGRFDDAGNLVVEEPGNLACSNGYFIYQRTTTCELAQDGTADCESFQPETNGRGPVRLRRG